MSFRRLQMTRSLNILVPSNVLQQQWKSVCCHRNVYRDKTGTRPPCSASDITLQQLKLSCITFVGREGSFKKSKAKRSQRVVGFPFFFLNKYYDFFLNCLFVCFAFVKWVSQWNTLHTTQIPQIGQSTSSLQRAHDQSASRRLFLLFLHTSLIRPHLAPCSCSQ